MFFFINGRKGWQIWDKCGINFPRWWIELLKDLNFFKYVRALRNFIAVVLFAKGVIPSYSISGFCKMTICQINSYFCHFIFWYGFLWALHDIQFSPVDYLKFVKNRNRKCFRIQSAWSQYLFGIQQAYLLSHKILFWSGMCLSHQH